MKKFIFMALLAVFLNGALPAEAAEKTRMLDQMFGTAGKESQTISAIPEEDKALITTYIDARYAPMCKMSVKGQKNCKPLPERKRYAKDMKMGGGIYSTAPADLVRQLKPLPRGYKYVRVNRDIVLVNSGMIVLDAVVGTPEMTEADLKNSGSKKVRTFKGRAPTAPAPAPVTSPE